MGKVKPFELEKLVVGIMYTNSSQYHQITKLLEDIFGDTDIISDEYVFSKFSTYYDKEMNGIVLKRFISFRNCLNPASLAKIKLQTNAIEDKLANGKDRIVNIDPCLLSHGKFIMATTKSASFRVPLQSGIYADLSLVYSRGQWEHFYWTYFDVKTDYIKQYLSEVRKRYLEQRKDQQF